MYKITLRFEGNVEGSYTQEEAIAFDEEEVMKILDRMIDRWANILIPYIDTKTGYLFRDLSIPEVYLPITIDEIFLPYFQKHVFSHRMKYILMLLDKEIDILNKFDNPNDHNRVFKICIELKLAAKKKVQKKEPIEGYDKLEKLKTDIDKLRKDIQMEVNEYHKRLNQLKIIDGLLGRKVSYCNKTSL